mgnify:CR=1 FL=1
MNDITSAFDSMFNMFLGGFKDCFSILDSITFRGISLLDFVLWILALSIILPIVLTLLSAGRSASETYYHKQSRQAEAEARRAERK